jgi:HD-like signal output (HDOD) protein
MTQLPPIEIDPKTFFRRHFGLPALPEVVSRVQDLIQSDAADIGKVTDLVKGEPALVAQILKVVNSAYYGLPREIGSVKNAIAFIGMNEIYRMVLSLSVINTLAFDQKDELAKFWYHSFYTALCSRYLARRYAPVLSPEELWCGAILHDIGKLIYLKFFPEHYNALMRYCSEQGCLFSEAERHFSLPSSAYFGSLLSEYWRLPSHVKAACETHSLKDLPGIDPNTALGNFQLMICLGNLLTVLSADELTDRSRQEISTATRTALDCTEQQFLIMMGDIYDLKTEVEKFMGQFQ